MLPLSLAIALSSLPRDGLAPLQPGVDQVGTRFDLVMRPESGACRFLLSDAESDAPVVEAKLALHTFGKAGVPPVDASAVAGRYDGHYLAACPAPGDALVVDATAGQGSDLFTFSSPPTPEERAPVPPAARLPALVVLLALPAALLLRRRWSGKALLSALILLVAGDAVAHGADETGLPIAPGSELSLGQEIQFALGLRTARVTVASFAPPPGLAGAAARSSPSVPRSAVVERDGKKLVFVRLAPERFVARQVTLGWSSGSDVAVEAGLQPGDLAVVAGGAFLRNGGASR